MSVEKSKFTDSRFNDFLEKTDLTDLYNQFELQSAAYHNVQQQIADAINNLSEHYSERKNQYGNRDNWYGYGSIKEKVNFEVVMTELKRLCKEECDIAFQATNTGKELNKYKNLETEALDYIYGYNQQDELLCGLKDILKDTKITMLEDYHG